MNKAELIKALERFPDDIEIRLGIRKSSCTWEIEDIDKFYGDDFVTLEPGNSMDREEQLDD